MGSLGVTSSYVSFSRAVGPSHLTIVCVVRIARVRVARRIRKNMTSSAVIVASSDHYANCGAAQPQLSDSNRKDD